MSLGVPLMYNIVLSVLSVLFFILIYYWSFEIWEELHQDFDEDCIESVDCFQWNCHLLCWSYLFKSMGDLSIYWYRLYFLFTMTWSYCGTGLSVLWLVLTQNILCYFWLLLILMFLWFLSLLLFFLPIKFTIHFILSHGTGLQPHQSKNSY